VISLLFITTSGERIRRESDLQLLFRLTWFGTPADVSREVNDGRGPVDFKVSVGVFDKSLVEFKLASNSKLRANLEKQVPIYQKASESPGPSRSGSCDVYLHLIREGGGVTR
jgi:hypothetical protein